MVRRPERPLRRQAVDPKVADDALHTRDLDRLAPCHRRQDRRKPPGQHRLATAGRPLEQDVVAAGRGDLEGALAEFVAA